MRLSLYALCSYLIKQLRSFKICWLFFFFFLYFSRKKGSQTGSLQCCGTELQDEAPTPHGQRRAAVRAPGQAWRGAIN